MAKSIYQSTRPDITYISFELKFRAHRIFNNFTETYIYFCVYVCVCVCVCVCIYLFAYSFQSSLNYSFLLKIQTIG